MIGERVPAIERAIPRHLFGTSQHLLLLCASYPGPRPRPRPGPRPAPRDHSAPARDPRAACGCLTSTATGRAAILSLDYDPAAIPRPSHLSLWTLHPSPAPLEDDCRAACDRDRPAIPRAPGSQARRLLLLCRRLPLHLADHCNRDRDDQHAKTPASAVELCHQENIGCRRARIRRPGGTPGFEIATSNPLP